MVHSHESPGTVSAPILVLLTAIRLLAATVHAQYDVVAANVAPGSAALIPPDNANKLDLESFNGSSFADPAFLAEAFATTFSDGEQRLMIIGDENIPTDPVCRGQPTVMTRSATIPPNGACLPSQTAQNLSCTCLQGYSDATTWEFRLTAPSQGKTSFPTSQTQEDTLEVNSMMLFLIPGNITAIVVNTTPDEATISLVRTEKGTDLTSVYRASVCVI
uniref:Uncharacterized protein n=1 Tax=Globisporangium ultimum (strain ATCC 200006 / CBS 805.95 / DAOM BR144) TaxID=431595 RepID=K3WH64_GLOUD